MTSRAAPGDRARGGIGSRIALVLLLAGMATAVGAQAPTGEPELKPPQARALGDAKVAMHNGAFASDVAIAVPPFHGIAPQLSLSYSSAGGNGFAGVGWELRGFSVIERAAPGRGSPRYGQAFGNDTYLLDGEELVPSTALGGNYAKRRQDFLKIQGSSASWIVTQRDGTVLTYNPLLVVGSQTFRWGLSQVRDTHGNTVSYAWSCDGSLDCYPSTVSYANTVVTIFKEARPDPETFATGKQLGRTNHRLRSIVVRNGGALVRAYKVGYATSTRNGRSLVTSIQQFGKDAAVDGAGGISGGTTLPATTATWADTAAGFENIQRVDTLYGLSTAIWGRSDVHVGDFNGDGRSDLILYDKNGTTPKVYRLLAIAGGFANAVDMTTQSGMTQALWLYSHVEQIGDFNGDGTDDLLLRYSQINVATRMYRLLGSKTGTFANAVDIAARYGLDATKWTYSSSTLGDYNGDGMGDLLVRGMQGSLTYNYLLTASGNGEFATAVNVATLYGMNADKWNSYTTSGDFNGDGRTDLILRHLSDLKTYLLQASPAGGFNTVVDVSAKYFASPNNWWYANVITGDYNGDGRTDLFFERDYLTNSLPFQVLYAQGSDGSAASGGQVAFENAVDVTTAYGMSDQKWRNARTLAGDYNGDGRTDLLVVSYIANPQDPTFLLLSNGVGFQAARDVTALYGMSTANWGNVDHFQQGDFDGDGDDDLLEVNYLASQPYPAGILRGNGALGTLVTALANGFGSTTTVAYVPSATWGNTNNPPRSQTVSSLTVSDGRGGSMATSYQYDGAAWDSIERRHLGFRYLRETDASGAYVENYFYQGKYFQAGELEDRYVRNAGGGVMSRTLRTLTGGGTEPYVRLLSQQDDWECNGDAACKQAQKKFTYDGFGNVTSATDMGDAAVAGDESNTVYEYNTTSGAYLVGFPWRVSTYQGAGTATLLRQTLTTYDLGVLGAAPVRGDATRVQQWLDTNGTFIASSATFDSFGNRTTETDPLSHTTTVVWDAAGLFPLSTTNAAGHVQTSTWDAGCALELTATDANNQTTSWTYDPLCRRKKENRPDGGWTDFAYDYWGIPGQQYNAQFHNDPGTGPQWTLVYFDGLAREWLVANRASIAVQTNYDNRGLVASVSAPYATGELPKLTSYSYDAARRLVMTMLPDSSTRQVLYGDWSATTCDELGKPRTRFVDSRGRVRMVREYIGAACSAAPPCVAGSCFETRIDYDVLDQRIAITDAAGNIGTTAYDSLGRRRTNTDPDLGAWSYIHDAAGRMTSQTDAKGNTLQLDYDVIDRPTQKKTSSGTILATYFYDEAGHGMGIGRRTRMTDPSGSSSVTYDVRGNVIAEQKTIGGTPYSIGRSFDRHGRLASVTYPDGEVVPYTYDTAGRLQTVGTYVTNATYDARGHLLTRDLGNGVRDTMTYDANRFWLASIKAAKGTTNLEVINLTHNTRGEVLTRNNVYTGSKDKWTYTYDDLRRLTVADNTSLNGNVHDQSFEYDGAGRMTKQVTNGVAAVYLYPTGGSAPRHAPSSVGGAAHAYDANGNLQSATGIALTFDVENRPILANGQTMAYDGDGSRVMLGSTKFVSNLYEVDAGGVATKYVLFGDSLIARKRAGVVHYYHGDQLGSVTLMSDAAGAVASRKVFSAFGRMVLQPVVLADAFGLAGQRLDSTGLYHMGAREMAPGLGIFVTPDPSEAPDPEDPQTLNRYAYVENNPTNLFDPTGYASKPGKVTQTMTALEKVFPQIRAARFGFELLICGGCDTTYVAPEGSGEVTQVGFPLFIDGFAGSAATKAVMAARGARGASGAAGALADDIAEQGAPKSPLLTRYLGESGGRWGGTATRQQNHLIASQYERAGSKVVGGAGRAAEEWIPGPGGATKGGTFVDITIQQGGKTLRIQTVDTLKDGITPTVNEAAAAARIRTAFPNDILVLIPKVVVKKQ